MAQIASLRAAICDQALTMLRGTRCDGSSRNGSNGSDYSRSISIRASTSRDAYASEEKCYERANDDLRRKWSGRANGAALGFDRPARRHFNCAQA